jgi:hypothetical protein
MQEQVLTEWLASPETQTLVKYLHRRKAQVVGPFLAGQVVDPVVQGRAVALHELSTLLAKPAEEVMRVFKGETT